MRAGTPYEAYCKIFSFPARTPRRRLNQVEVYFSVIQCKLLTPDDSEDLETLAAQILAFRQHDPGAPHPMAAWTPTN